MNCKNNKGVTLIALAITIVIATILIVSVSISTDKLSDSNNFYKTRQDIIALSKAVQTYYLKEEGSLPPGIASSANTSLSFANIIKLNNSIDRNPNDNDIYYILYKKDNAHKTILANYLPEVNISEPNNTYLINAKSLTVYCENGYMLDENRHYTASESFSGGQYASEYYKNVNVRRN